MFAHGVSSFVPDASPAPVQPSKARSPGKRRQSTLPLDRQSVAREFDIQRPESAREETPYPHFSTHPSALRRVLRDQREVPRNKALCQLWHRPTRSESLRLSPWLAEAIIETSSDRSHGRVNRARCASTSRP